MPELRSCVLLPVAKFELGRPLRCTRLEGISLLTARRLHHERRLLPPLLILHGRDRPGAEHECARSSCADATGAGDGHPRGFAVD